MKIAVLAFAASLAAATGAAAQDHDHGAGHAEHGAAQEHGAGHAAGDHQHEPAHYLTEMHATHVLRDTIIALQAGTPDYDTMVPELAQAVRDQSAAMAPALAGLGAFQSMEHIAEPQPGVHQFRVTFANGQSTWTISINGENKIQGLLMQ